MNATRIFWATRDRALHLSLVVLGGLVMAGVLRLVGVPPIDLHGPLHYLGVMDPLCGGTRAAYLLTKGDLAGAWHYNPIVFVLAAVAAGLLLRAAVGVTRGRWLEVHLSKRARRVAAVALALGLVVLEIRQQLLADLLTQRWPGQPTEGPLGALPVVPVGMALVAPIALAAIWLTRRGRRNADSTE